MHKASKSYGKIPGVIGRSGYGLEFILAVAYQVYSLGLSFDKVALLTRFFQGLKIGKSQIDAMLNQLAKHLEGEFDNLCSMVANSMILHADETSWSIHSVWAFITENARVLLHGVHKDASTLEAIVNPTHFGGVAISDHASVYGRFTKMQKCWAHLLRKSIQGAKRRTIVVSTIESIRCFMHRFTLENVVHEILSWTENGISCFAKRLSEINNSVKLTGLLEQLYPKPSPS